MENKKDISESRKRIRIEKETDEKKEEKDDDVFWACGLWGLIKRQQRFPQKSRGFCSPNGFKRLGLTVA